MRKALLTFWNGVWAFTLNRISVCSCNQGHISQKCPDACLDDMAGKSHGQRMTLPLEVRPFTESLMVNSMSSPSLLSTGLAVAWVSLPPWVAFAAPRSGSAFTLCVLMMQRNSCVAPNSWPMCTSASVGLCSQEGL